MIIGLTGKYCSGKSSVAEEFEKKGFFIIEVDKLGHDALKTKKNEVEETFGSAVIKNEQVDRKDLGKIVFKSSKKREMLEKIVHPVMVQEVEEILKKQLASDTDVASSAATGSKAPSGSEARDEAMGSDTDVASPAATGSEAPSGSEARDKVKNKNILIDAAILAHMGLHKYCDAVIWVKAPFFKRLGMALYRDNRGIFFALRRMISQRKLKSNLTKKHVDTYIIHNTGDLNSLPGKVENILKTINFKKNTDKIQ